MQVRNVRAILRHDLDPRKGRAGRKVAKPRLRNSEKTVAPWAAPPQAGLVHSRHRRHRARRERLRHAVRRAWRASLGRVRAEPRRDAEERPRHGTAASGERVRRRRRRGRLGSCAASAAASSCPPRGRRPLCMPAAARLWPARKSEGSPLPHCLAKQGECCAPGPRRRRRPGRARPAQAAAPRARPTHSRPRASPKRGAGRLGPPRPGGRRSHGCSLTLPP